MGSRRFQCWSAVIRPIRELTVPRLAMRSPGDPPCFAETERKSGPANSPNWFRSSGSPKKCPSSRGQRASKKVGPFPFRARSAPCPAAFHTSSTSVPSTSRAGMPKLLARSTRFPPVTPWERVVTAHSLSLQTKSTGSFQATARLMLSTSIPWFMAPSPKKATARLPGRRY
ncbi:hypothetical protein ES703_97678 [subsurface metagenome]